VGLLLLGVHHTCTIAVNARGTVEGICLLGGDGGLRGASAENWRRGSVATISKSAEGILPPRIWGFSAEADLRSLAVSSPDAGRRLGPGATFTYIVQVCSAWDCLAWSYNFQNEDAGVVDW
jgi:hypothetical protein